MMDPVAVATISYYGPGPNVPGDPFTGRNNFIFAGGTPNDANRNTFKVDHQINQNQRIFLRHTLFDVVSSAPELWEGPGCPDGGCYIVVAYTWSKLLSDGGDNAWDSVLWTNYYCRSCDKSLCRKCRAMGCRSQPSPKG